MFIGYITQYFLFFTVRKHKHKVEDVVPGSKLFHFYYLQYGIQNNTLFYVLRISEKESAEFLHNCFHLY